MAKKENGSTKHPTEQLPEFQQEKQIGAEFAKALEELNRGEQTATALESRLDDIENRIEQLLASVEAGRRHDAGGESDGTTFTGSEKQVPESK